MSRSLIGEKVIHRSLGEGSIISWALPYFQVYYPEKQKQIKHNYPDAFQDFLKFVDADLQNEADALLGAKKEATQQKLMAEEAAKQRALEQALAAARPARKKAASRTKCNMAFKCNFCDGGKNETCIGFRGVCSDEQIRTNVKTKKHEWCSKPNNPCSRYLAGEITRKELDEIVENGFLCYESTMLTNWTAEAGANLDQKGDQQKARKIHAVAGNHLALLTTRPPKAKEEDRIIFGVFIIGRFVEGNAIEAGYVQAKAGYSIALTPEEAAQMKFWNYYHNTNDSVRWGTGLFRYMADTDAIKILNDVVKIKQGDEKEHARRVLEHFMELNGLEPEA